jgi:hypothetical protein
VYVGSRLYAFLRRVYSRMCDQLSEFLSDALNTFAGIFTVRAPDDTELGLLSVAASALADPLAAAAETATAVAKVLSGSAAAPPAPAQSGASPGRRPLVTRSTSPVPLGMPAKHAASPPGPERKSSSAQLTRVRGKEGERLLTC